MKIKFIFLYLFVLLLFSGISQQNKNDSLYIQFSGIVVTQDSLKPLPYCTVIDKSTRRGTITDFFGYFSFVAKPNDVIRFSSVGYKNAEFIIPDTLTTNKYSLIQIMFEDTIMLKTATIYPWPSKEQFAKAFVETKIPNDDYQRALANLSRSQLQDRMEFTPMDGAQNFKWQQQQIQTKLYYAGQYPPNQLFNPVAWIKFIEAWKRGDFKKK
ncbi:MAG: hypothetical protein CL846_00175 [Crocinitomicaceae bacterium]|nr:hypothetical protein [Crocinitomicaceae bacterium]|tara:strand:+ start:7915 stop:8550 length:636 start_codon:yes stop_codon:yes gene_type:complete